MIILRVGDPHVKINNLNESTKLMEFVFEQAKLNYVDRIELLGDLFHTHAVVRVEVLDFWDKWLNKLSKRIDTVVLVGNHDQVGDFSSKQHALQLFKNLPNSNLLIVDAPHLYGKVGQCLVGYLPYIHNEEEFIAEANNLVDRGAMFIVCHGTFEGSQFENGFWAPDGFDMNKIKAPFIISGHIHRRQRFGKVIYPGTAKWDTNSDANEEKGLWLVEHDDITGEIVKEVFIDTSSVCTPIHSFEWKEGQDQPVIPPGRVTIELVGSSEWIRKQKDKLKGKCGLKSKITDKIKLDSRKTSKSLSDFVNSNFDPVTGITKEQILNFMKENELV